MNPGLGGTQFSAVMLGYSLANSDHAYNLCLVNNTALELEDPPSNLTQIDCPSFEKFLETIADKECLVICAAYLLYEVDLVKLKAIQDKIVPWIHHPFDLRVRQLGIQFPAYVCVGTYQYYSLQPFYEPLWHIQNIFVRPQVDSGLEQTMPSSMPSSMPSPLPSPPDFEQGETLEIVYLGALVQGKGFHEIARQWRVIEKEFPETRLHVIGSSLTYGQATGSELVPTSKAYAEEILAGIPEADIKSRQVIFYGNLGPEKFEIIRSCHLALLNPTGQTEAFPATPLECMALGVPVIASDDYGMSDAMRFFPSLSLSRPDEIPQVIGYLLGDKLRYLELSERSVAVAAWFASQQPQIVRRWYRLIAQLSSRLSTQSLSEAAPIMNFDGSRWKFWKRLLRTRWALSRTSRTNKP